MQVCMHVLVITLYILYLIILIGGYAEVPDIGFVK